MTALSTTAAGAGAAAIALALLPAVIATAPGKPEVPEASAIVVELTGSQGGADPYALAVTASGTPSPATLRDETGLHTGKVIALPAQNCAKAPRRRAFETTDAKDTWCLGLQDVDAGSELSGTVEATGGAELPLVVRRRDGFWWKPFGVLILGLLVGGAATLLPAWLTRKVRSHVLRDLILEGKAVAGLPAWVASREREGVDLESLINEVGWTLEHGPPVTEEAWGKLRAAIKSAREAGVAHPLLAAAEKAGSNGAVRMADLYDGPLRRGKHVDEARADQVDRLHAVHTELASAEQAVRRLRENVREELERLLRVANLRYRGLKSLDDLASLDEPLEKLQAAIVEARAAVMAASEGFRPISPEESDVSTAPRGQLETTGTTEGRRRGAKIALGLLTLLLVLLLPVYAVLSVRHAAYAPKPLFHDFGDYFDLFAAALASGVAAAVIGLLSIWRREPLAAGS